MQETAPLFKNVLMEFDRKPFKPPLDEIYNIIQKQIQLFDMKQTNLFNKYSAIAFAVLLVLPLIYKANLNTFSSYFDAFDKLSIPLWAALYSYFWIVFNRQIKLLSRQVLLLQNKVSSYSKIDNKEYRTQQKEDEEELTTTNIQLSDARIHLEFINVTLRVTIILAASVKIGQLLSTLISPL